MVIDLRTNLIKVWSRNKEGDQPDEQCSSTGLRYVSKDFTQMFTLCNIKDFWNKTLREQACKKYYYSV